MISTASSAVAEGDILTLNVRASSTQIGDFKAATFDSSDAVPVAFAFCWITVPEVRAKIADMIGAGQVPLHASQSFESIAPVIPGSSYILDLCFSRIETPPGLAIKGQVSRPDGFIILYMQTLLRLLPVSEAME